MSVSDESTIAALYKSIGAGAHDPAAARIVVHGNEVVGKELVPGLDVDTEETADGINAVITVRGGVQIERPVHMCFGVLPETGRQHIGLQIRMEPAARASLLAHCAFPNARDVTHEMDADIVVADGAAYSYIERHVHGPEGGVVVVPKARVQIGADARFNTEFQLIHGNVGRIDVDYHATVGDRSTLEMATRISGRGDDVIKLHEAADLVGEAARGVLNSYIAVRERARAEIRNTLVASGPYARGHVDCKEIVQDDATAAAIPIVEARHAKAHVTHEAAIGSVDTKQLETLMARGLDEDAAVDLIIRGLLS